MNNLTILNKNESVISTREIAEMMEINHWEVLRKLEGTEDGKTIGIIPTLTNNKIVVSEYFLQDIYKDGSGKENKFYSCTKMGCEFLANKFTGVKGMIFTAKYVKKFNDMEQLSKSVQPKLSKEIQAIFVLDQRTEEIDTRLITLEGSMTIDYSQQEELRTSAGKKIIKILGGKDAPAYKECSKKAFSELWKAFKRIVQVNSYRNTASKEYEYAKEVINNWEPNRDLELMILGANSQFKINL